MEKTTKAKCGCEFTEVISNDGLNSVCYLSKCRCEFHYKEQFIAEWYDKEGHHREMYDPSNVLPLEVQE